MKYSKFEELPIWQESRKFVEQVYHLLLTNKTLRSDFSLCDQLKRSAYSVMLNIAEGFERGSNKDFSHFIDFAKGSAGEVRSILYILLDNKFVSKEQFEELKERIENISSQLSGLKKYLVKNNFKKNF